MITKRQSGMLQGIAILLMMYHHFFLNPEELALTYQNPELVKSMAWFGKICVGMFAFVSGYGMFHVFAGQEKTDFFTDLKWEYKEVLHRLFAVLGKYWYVLFLFKGIDYIFRKEPFFTDIFWKQILVIDVSYNGTWWYLQQYIMMMLMIPLLDLLLTPYQSENIRKKRIWYGISGACIISVSLFLWIARKEEALQIFHALRPSFTAVFATGYLFARYAVIQKLRLEKLAFWKQIAVGIFGILCMMALRISITTEASFARYDFAIVPVFSICCILLFDRMKILAGGLQWLGKNSTYMWLIHVFIFSYTKDFCLQLSKNQVVFYAVQVALTAVFSWMMRKVIEWRRVK